MGIFDYITKKSIISSGGALGILVTVVKNTSVIASAMNTIISFVTTEQGISFGTTGVSIVLIGGGAILYMRTLHDEQMRRIDNLEKRTDESIDDLKKKIDLYHEIDVRTYERLCYMNNANSNADANANTDTKLN